MRRHQPPVQRAQQGRAEQGEQRGRHGGAQLDAEPDGDPGETGGEQENGTPGGEPTDRNGKQQHGPSRPRPGLTVPPERPARVRRGAGPADLSVVTPAHEPAWTVPRVRELLAVQEQRPVLRLVR
ncbi:hypothetical protein GCM10010259_59570 [Streptomyces daghestanicus]|uniref:Uncharacterized protein n=1 Tax=Streptomyces daghestanicus TaxID=66885 RepID=A0ABQ3Q5W9_9ACTN|nr:hypothetical protein GCM10010259_59570 [Streptomyces daghestanicus]GHI32649.1 hypothetical protein Sdagh_43790 [Streptomyces daghestanicus]